MKTYTIFAKQDFSLSGVPVAAGEELGTIESRLTPGELVSALRNGRCDASSDDEEEESQIPQAPTESPAASVPAPTATDDPTLLEAGVDDRFAEMYAEEGVTTVSELKAWLADGHQLTDPDGIGPKTAKQIASLLGL